MKKRRLLLLTAICILSCSCNNIEPNESINAPQTVEKTSEKVTDPSTQKKTEPTTLKEKIPFYMGSVRQQYDEANKEHIFFWQFQDVNKEPIAAKSNINICIKNDKNEEVFNKDFEVNANNYSTWSNKLSSTSQLLGSISIADSDLAQGSSTKGVATLTASSEYSSFKPVNITVFDLPQKGITVNYPPLPITSNSYSYNGEIRSAMTVTDISQEYDYSLKLNVTAQMTYNSNGDGARDYGHVGYVITNESGMVINSGTVLFDQLAVGETQVKQIYVRDAEPGDTLNLQIIDHN
ncbi:hypothetical protein [Ruminococcus sp.]|uniref:hypothetical protein n=1 Tax=Ruminococcus sp. TaxID=41978 RepID=UPI0025EAB782|nr:hypothetical protein [Ruminococcus sp.]